MRYGPRTHTRSLGGEKEGNGPSARRPKFALVIVPLSLVLVATVLYLTTRHEQKAAPAPAEDVVAVAGEVHIPLSRVRGGAVKFFRYTTPNGVEVRFLVVEAPSNRYRAALDASENASASFHARGDHLICTHCGFEFDKTVVGDATGDCSPIPLHQRIMNQDLVIEVAQLEQAETYFAGMRDKR